MLSIGRPLTLVICGLVILLLSGTTRAQDKSKAKANEKDAISRKVVVELQKLFKIWDGNKDRFADQDELQKFATSVKPKTPKAKNQPKEEADPGAAAMTTLLTKIDEDQDQKFSQDEFDRWASVFARDLVEMARLQADAARIQQELTKLEELSKRSGNVTAGEGIFQDTARRGIIQYQQQLKELAAQAEKVQADGGHAGYREFLQRELMKRMKF